jgi:hypothetical protein
MNASNPARRGEFELDGCAVSMENRLRRHVHVAGGRSMNRRLPVGSKHATEDGFDDDPTTVPSVFAPDEMTTAHAGRVMARRMGTLRSRFLAGCCAVAMAVALPGCAVRVISGYDETTDKAVTALQRKTEAHLVSLESLENSPECAYDKHKIFYDEARVDVSAIEVRAAAIPQNEITTEQIRLLAQSLNSLGKLHKIGCLSKDQIAPLRIQLNSSFISILKLELAKRQGE